MSVEFNATRERAEFEAAMFAHYVRKRAERRAKGQGIAFDNADRPHTPETMFERTQQGEYVAVVYQAAWTGWKMARGGV